MSSPKFPKISFIISRRIKETNQRIFQTIQEKPLPAISNFILKHLVCRKLYWLFIFILFFLHLLSVWAILECILLGCLTAAIGFNVMHDGAHGSFSRYKWINSIASNAANFLGASQYMWKTKHNVIHHTYTNIHGVDDDIEARPLLRLCDEQPHYKIHQYQHFYFWAAYSLLYIYWIFVTDYKKYFSGKNRFYTTSGK